MAEQCVAALAVMRHGLRQGRILARVHVGRSGRHIAQGRRAKAALQVGRVDIQKTDFAALVGACITVGTQTGKWTRLELCNGRRATVVKRQTGDGGCAGIMKGKVCQQRPIVAVETLPLADQQPQTGRFVGAQARIIGGSRRQIARIVKGGDIAVKTPRLRQQGALIGRQRLAHVDRRTCDCILVRASQRTPGGLLLCAAHG